MIFQSSKSTIQINSLYFLYFCLRFLKHSMAVQTISSQFKKINYRILAIGIACIIFATIYSPYSTAQIMEMYLNDRYQLVMIHVLFNIIISVTITIITWNINKRVLKDVYNRLGILNQLRFSMRYFWIYGLSSLILPVLYWLHTLKS